MLGLTSARNDRQRPIVIYLDDFQAKVDRLKALQAQTAAEPKTFPPTIPDKASRREPC